MAAVADRLHALGLGFGMYSDAGKYTCGGYSGSLGYETVDANTFASWGVDYLKYDNCYNMGQAGNQQISEARYATMANALNATGRPILYSLCNWGEDYPWNWGSTIANVSMNSFPFPLHSLHFAWELLDNTSPDRRPTFDRQEKFGN
jgi:alpha-galactosidase